MGVKRDKVIHPKSPSSIKELEFKLSSLAPESTLFITSEWLWAPDYHLLISAEKMRERKRSPRLCKQGVAAIVHSHCTLLTMYWTQVCNNSYGSYPISSATHTQQPPWLRSYSRRPTENQRLNSLSSIVSKFLHIHSLEFFQLLAPDSCMSVADLLSWKLIKDWWNWEGTRIHWEHLCLVEFSFL